MMSRSGLEGERRQHGIVSLLPSSRSWAFGYTTILDPLMHIEPLHAQGSSLSLIWPSSYTRSLLAIPNGKRSMKPRSSILVPRSGLGSETVLLLSVSRETR